jgi:hypothetical protein
MLIFEKKKNIRDKIISRLTRGNNLGKPFGNFPTFSHLLCAFKKAQLEVEL